MAAFAFSLSESVSFYLVYLSLYRPKAFFLKQIWGFHSFFSSDQGIKHLGIFGLLFVWGFFHIVNLIRISCFVLFYFGIKFSISLTFLLASEFCVSLHLEKPISENSESVVKKSDAAWKSFMIH